MREVIRIFESIKGTSSLNEKYAIIKDNSENELFKRCLIFLLNYLIVTGISDKKLHKEISIENIKYMADADFNDI